MAGSKKKLTFVFHTGEQGKVEESMREMAAIEALKSEKAEKEVSDEEESGMNADAVGVARTSTIDGHVWGIWTSKASCV